MEITINGEQKILDGPMSISTLLDSLGIDPETVVVEKNLDILAREEHDDQTLAAGDSVEIIRLVDGG